MPSTSRYAVLALVAFATLHCGGDPPPPPAPPPPPPPVVAPPPPAPTATASTEPAPPPEPVPTETAPKPSGRPPVLKTSDSEITDTFGSSPAAKLELGAENERAVLKIPELALTKGYNVTFKLDPKGKSNGALLGKVYRTRVQEAGAAEFVKVSSSGAPFEFQFPAGNKKNANLAVGEITTDDKGREKVVWTVLHSTKIDDATGVAYFEIPYLADAYVHVTSKPATTAPPSPKE